MVIIFVIVFLFSNLENIGRDILLVYLPEKYVFHGFGIIFGILLMYFSGIVLKLAGVRRFFSRIPILGLFFGGGEVITVERLVHLSPCLFMMSPTCPSYGWILSEETVELGKEKAIFTLVNVYHPMCQLSLPVRFFR